MTLHKSKNYFNLSILFTIGLLIIILVFQQDIQNFFGTNNPSQAASVTNNGYIESMPNPAIVYCSQVMGYKYTTITNPDRSQSGFCIMPNDFECPQWEFYSGECGNKYNFCGVNGYDTIIGNHGEDPYSPYYAICTSTTDGITLGPVSNLTNLTNIISNSFDAIQ